MEKVKLYFKLSRIPLDILAILAAFPQSYLLRYGLLPNLGFESASDFYLPFTDYYTQLEWLLPVALIILILNKAYSLSDTYSLLKEWRIVIYSSLLLTFVAVFYYFLTRTYPPSRLVIFYYSGLLCLNLIFTRFILFYTRKVLLKYNIGKINVVVLGNSKIAKKLIQSLAKNEKYHLLGYIADRSTELPIKWLGKYEKIDSILNKYKVDSIIQVDSSQKFDTETGLKVARKRHLEYQYVPSDYNIHKHKFHVSNLEDIPWLKWEKTTLEGWGRIYKRVFDIIIAATALLLLSPLLIFISVMIKVNSAGPVFFRLKNNKLSQRVGHKGKKFSFFKFRSMAHNTHEQRYSKLSEKNKRSGPLVKIKDDPRITTVGKWLRRFDFDELPQLINVLKGDMSIVGPRPHLPEEVENYEDNDHFVLTVKPGITGLAQVSGRSELSFNEEVILDSYYIEHWSPVLDLKIILKTIPAVLFKKQD